MKHLSAIKSIRKYCLDCSCQSIKEVRDCVIPECPLYPYRMGRNPNIKPGTRKGNPEALKKARLRKKSPDQPL